MDQTASMENFFRLFLFVAPRSLGRLPSELLLDRVKLCDVCIQTFHVAFPFSLPRVLSFAFNRFSGVEMIHFYGVATQGTTILTISFRCYRDITIFGVLGNRPHRRKQSAPVSVVNFSPNLSFGGKSKLNGWSALVLRLLHQGLFEIDVWSVG